MSQRRFCSPNDVLRDASPPSPATHHTDTHTHTHTNTHTHTHTHTLALSLSLSFSLSHTHTQTHLHSAPLAFSLHPFLPPSLFSYDSCMPNQATALFILTE